MSDSAMEDLFGENPNRPDVPEFWRLSEIVLGMDASLENVGFPNDEALVASAEQRTGIPIAVIDYMAMNRSLPGFIHFCGPFVQVALIPATLAHSLSAAAWSDGFCAGIEYQKKYGVKT